MKRASAKEALTAMQELEKKAILGVVVDNRGQSVDLSTATELEGFDFEGWDFSRLDLSHIKSFSGCKFRGAKFDLTRLSGEWDSCDLEDASFEYGNITDATFTNTNFEFTKLNRTRLDNVTIGKGSSLHFSRWTGVSGDNLTIGPGLEDLEGWELRGGSFYGLKIDGGTGEYGDSSRADFSAEIENSTLRAFEMSNIDMKHFKFKNNELASGQFKNVDPIGKLGG